MKLPEGEETKGARTAALRREIQRAGAQTALLRTGMECARPLGCLVVPITLAVGSWLWSSGMPGVVTGLTLVAVLLVVSASVARPVAAAYRRLREQQLRRKLARLPREELSEVLLPLRHYAFYDTRRLVEPLIEHLRPEGTELAPSAAPEGTGSEPAATEP